MADTKERKIISPEEFSERKNRIIQAEDIQIPYIIIWLRDHGHSLEDIASLFEISVKELLEDEDLANIVNVQSGKKEDIEKLVTDDFKFIFSEIELFLENVNLDDGYKIFENEEYQSIIQKITEYINNQRLDFVEELSKCDLSLIPPEMYQELPKLEHLRFEGTGAKLDFSQLGYKDKIVGSLRGCQIISFNPFRYGRELMDDNDSFRPNSINADCLDESQYQTILDGYRLIGRCFPNELFFLFSLPEIPENNAWFFDEIMMDKEISLDIIANLWKALRPENQNRYRCLLERIIERTNRYYDYSLRDAISKTDISIIDEYESQIREIYNTQDGKTDINSFINGIFYAYPTELQVKKFEDTINYVENNIDIFQGQNSHDESILKVWKALNMDSQEQLFQKAFELCRNEDGAINVKLFIEIIVQKNSQLELPQYMLDTVFEMYRTGEISNDNNIVWGNIGEENQKNHLINFLRNQIKDGVSINSLYGIWNATDLMVREELLDDVVSTLKEENPELANKIKNEGYIQILRELPQEEREKKISDDISRFIDALWGKYNLTGKEISKDLIDIYNPEFAKILFMLDSKGTLDTTNFDIIIKNIPKLGFEVIDRTYNSNSEMIRNYANQLIVSVAELPKKEADETLRETEDIFSKDNVPNFIKIYKFFEILVGKNLIETYSIINSNTISPALNSSKNVKLFKKIIFSDLLKISMDSNNKSLLKFIEILEKGNNVYKKIADNNFDENVLTVDERKTLQEFIKTAYFMYEESDASKTDRKLGKKMTLTGNLEKDAISMGTRYSHDGHIGDLADRVLQGYIGGYRELFGGIDTVSKIKEYMTQRVIDSNIRHRRLAEELKTTRHIELTNGDLVKGIGFSSGFEVFTSIIEDGIRAGEFLGISNHSDATPLDTDFGIIKTSTPEMSIEQMISSTPASGYGSMYAIVKFNPQKIELSRKNGILNREVEEDSLAERLKRRRETSEIKRRISRRTTGNYTGKRLEMFNSDVISAQHYGIRTGLGISDVDYLVVRSYDKRYGYELAMSGIYVPIVSYSTGELLFTPEQFDEIRSQMQGLRHFNAGEFLVDKTAFTTQTEEIVQQLFPDGRVEESISEIDARKKRLAIQATVEKALFEELGLRLENHLTGDLTNGFVEFIDTGSTGRGTNLPGSGDFDFSMKIDRSIIDSPEKLAKFKGVLRNVLAIRSDDPKSSPDELGGNFRYKKVKINGIDQPIDLDITFMSKTEKITYSTDMCVRERLDGLKRNDPEGYKFTIANIVLAKKMLKQSGLYKKIGSDGATQYGGFGGVGVENWILQNGGSFARAIDTFLEAAKKAKTFDEFQNTYPIFDFGQNHMAREYSHDSFIRGLSATGFTKMQEVLQNIREGLTPVSPEPRATVLSDSIIDGMSQMASQSRSGRIIETSQEFKSAVNEIEQPTKDSFKGE